MRYSSARKYPITQLKKEQQANAPERVVDLSIGAAAGILSLVFIEGVLWGYLCCRSFSKRK